MHAARGRVALRATRPTCRLLYSASVRGFACNLRPQHSTPLFTTLPSHTRSCLRIPPPVQWNSIGQAAVRQLCVKAPSPAPPSTLAKTKGMLSGWSWAYIKEGVSHAYHHYKNGTILLISDIRVASKYCGKMATGKTLTRREHRMLVRVIADMGRIIPLSFFVLVPFMEFALPFALKLVPGLLPSQFDTKFDKEQRLKHRLKVKLEVAKVMQDTVEEMTHKIQKQQWMNNTLYGASDAGGKQYIGAKKLRDFMDTVQSGVMVSNTEVLQHLPLFKDSITLDNMGREQLVHMAKFLHVSSYGTEAILRFQLRMKLRQLKADDQLINWEGIHTLKDEELRNACRERGMVTSGLQRFQLEHQLQQWLDLSQNKEVPSSLLILSQMFRVTADTPHTLEEELQSAMSTMSDEVVDAVIEDQTTDADNETRLKTLRKEEQKLRDEEIMMAQADAESEEEAKKKKKLATAQDQPDASTEDEKPLTREEINDIADQVLTMASDSAVKEEQEQLDKLISDHDKVSKHISTACASDKSINRLNAKVDKMVEDLQEEVMKAEEQIGHNLKMLDEHNTGQITVQELAVVVALMRKQLSENQKQQINRFMDSDNDGKVSIAELREAIEQARNMGLEESDHEPHEQAGRAANDPQQYYP